MRTDDSIRNLGERDIDGGLQKAKFKWNGDAGRQGKRGCHPQRTRTHNQQGVGRALAEPMAGFIRQKPHRVSFRTIRPKPVIEEVF